MWCGRRRLSDFLRPLRVILCGLCCCIFLAAFLTFAVLPKLAELERKGVFGIVEREPMVSTTTTSSGKATNVRMTSATVYVKKLLNATAGNCPLPMGWEVDFPECSQKIEWMKSMWSSDPCYAKYGVVDGDVCSMITYLSEVEHHCPILRRRLEVERRLGGPNVPTEQQQFAQLRLGGPADLFALMNDNPNNYQWMTERIFRMWPKWLEGLASLRQKRRHAFEGRQRKRILLHIGCLTKESGFKFSEKLTSGGPLGELVQWSDLLASLYILGHELIISTKIATFKICTHWSGACVFTWSNFSESKSSIWTFHFDSSAVEADKSAQDSCPPLPGEQPSATAIDIIYTDIVGFRQIKKKLPRAVGNFKCRMRILDSFGTQAEFNDNAYFVKHKAQLGGNKKNPWGGHQFNLQQFNTMYPHSPDNTFLGFVVELHNERKKSDDELSAAKTAATRAGGNGGSRIWSLVYGKEAYMWQGCSNYLDAVAERTELHATVSTRDKNYSIHPKAINHGVLNGTEFHRLLRQVRLFVGLGFPFEGPATLEAIASGAIFLNPAFPKPKGRMTEKFFADKPTLRELTSQNPYVEQFVGLPHVITVDVQNKTALDAALSLALRTKVEPFLPYEFTSAGMLERVSALLEGQDFCFTESKDWPPFSSAHVFLATAGHSCQNACRLRGLICEPSYFRRINRLEVMQRFGRCPSSQLVSDSAAAPSIVDAEHGECLLQKNKLLFSCATAPEPSRRRLCPCRDFVLGQTALCRRCL